MNERVPVPILYNYWKHHFNFQVAELLKIKKENDVVILSEKFRYIGTSTADLYTGKMKINEISSYAIEWLANNQINNEKSYFEWINNQVDHYHPVIFPDKSIWILKAGNIHARYAHIHPGRNVPLTVRVKANVLKTALAVSALARVQSMNPMDINLINRARKEVIGLHPVRFVLMNHELGKMIHMFGKELGLDEF